MSEQYRPSPEDMGISDEENAVDSRSDKKTEKSSYFSNKAKQILKIGAFVAAGLFAGKAESAMAADTAPASEQSQSTEKHEWTEEQKDLLGVMYHVVVSKSAELDSAYYAHAQENLPDNIIDAFQKAGQNLSEKVVAQGGDQATFEAVLDMMYSDILKKLLPEEASEKPAPVSSEKAPAPKLDIDLPPLPDSAETNKEWMWQNIGKAFQRDGKVIAIGTAQSRDMQISVDKAKMVVGGVASDIYKTVTITQNGITTQSSGLLRGGQELGFDVRNNNGMYEAVVMMQFDAVVPTQPAGK